MDEIEIKSLLAYYSERYAGLISVAEAAEIAKVPAKTIYHWSSLGRLDDFTAKRGRHLRIGLNPFVRFLVTDN